MFLGDPAYVFRLQGPDIAAVAEVCRTGCTDIAALAEVCRTG